jgi:hypothetical protein
MAVIPVFQSNTCLQPLFSANSRMGNYPDPDMRINLRNLIAGTSILQSPATYPSFSAEDCLYLGMVSSFHYHLYEMSYCSSNQHSQSMLRVAPITMLMLYLF